MACFDELRGRHRVMVAMLFALALLTRLLYLIFARPPLENYHWALADSLLTDGSLSIAGVKTTAFEPLYPLFLAAARALAADHMFLVRTIQCAVGAAGAWLLYRLAAILTGRWRVGLVAATLYAIYPLLIRYAGDTIDATLMTVLVVGLAAAFVAAATPMRGAAAGVWLGLAILTRSMTLPLMPLGAALLWRDRGWRVAGAFAAAALAVIAPYAIRNYALNGSLLPTRSGINLFISNCEYTAGILPDYGPDILGDYAASALERRARVTGSPSPALERAVDVAYTRLAFEHIWADPLGTLSLKLRNVWYFFSPTLVPSRDPTAAMVFHGGELGRFRVENSRPRPALDRLMYAASYMPVLALALAGVWIRRRALGRDAILWAAVITFAAVHAIYFPTTRYRAPIEFVALFYAAVALDGLVSTSFPGSSRPSSERKSGSETNQPANAVFGTAPSTEVTRCST